eukprot:5790741-Ditylum_brightwellii.AAC.1
MVIENVWEDLRRKNTPVAEFITLQPYFQLNFDETSFMRCKGTLRVVASADREKHNLNLADDRSSMTVLRCGSAAGVNGP